jgi:hypothetical protein
MGVMTLNEVRANDSTAELATGGLLFTKSPDIEMTSEDLFISMKEIRVRYRFFNHSTHDVVTQVAFPMPDLVFGGDTNLAIPTNDPENFLGFSTTVDNRSIAALVERKAYLNGIDKTELLREMNVPLAPRASEKYDYLSQETWSRLIREGLIADTQRSDGYINPLWTLKTTYYWQQVFPASSEIAVSHRYTPSVGSVVPMPASDLLKQPSILQIDRSKGVNRFCIDQDFLNTMARSSKAALEQHFLEYILTTGANWSGPIKEFRLVIDKGASENLVSFCGEHVRKISATQFEVRTSGFTPNSNLSVLILTPEQGAPRGIEAEVGTQMNVAALTCDQLWHRRNDIFKSAGYCFHTPQAISVFGNAGCVYSNVSNLPLSDKDRQIVDQIQNAERLQMCQR